MNSIILQNWFHGKSELQENAVILGQKGVRVSFRNFHTVHTFRMDKADVQFFSTYVWICGMMLENDKRKSQWKRTYFSREREYRRKEQTIWVLFQVFVKNHWKNRKKNPEFACILSFKNSNVVFAEEKSLKMILQKHMYNVLLSKISWSSTLA